MPPPAPRYYATLCPAAGKLTINGLIGLAKNQEPDPLRALEHQSEQIDKSLRMISAALSPEVILFAGDVTTSWHLAHGVIERECKAGLLTGSCPRLLSIGDGELALLRGAAAVVLQRHSGSYRSAHGRQQRA